MNNEDRIKTYYSNARELIKQRNPKAARCYILEILNVAVKSYYASTSIISKAKTSVFLDRWIAVSRDLYEKGITDYVLECFGLCTESVSVNPKKRNRVKEVIIPKSEPIEPVERSAGKERARFESGEIDFSGLIDEALTSQGWCTDVFEKNICAVVEITVSASNYNSSGTGVIISDNGYLLTNDHVVFDEENGVYFSKIRMALYGGKKRFKLEVLFSDKSADIALCKFNPQEVESFSSVKRIPDYSKLMPGADCLVIGNAFGMGLAPFSGVVRFTKNNSGNLVYTAPSNPGDSGGPVFNRFGECIGINKSKTLAVNGTEADGYANATPMNEVDALLNKWISHNNIEL